MGGMRVFVVVGLLMGGALWGQGAKPVPRAEDQQIVVTTDASQVELTAPDPSQRVMVREELLDGNPGRPGAPLSIPGLPIETASGGIKAPQYFAPGVAGDQLLAECNCKGNGKGLNAECAMFREVGRDVQSGRLTSHVSEARPFGCAQEDENALGLAFCRSMGQLLVGRATAGRFASPWMTS